MFHGLKAYRTLGVLFTFVSILTSAPHASADDYSGSDAYRAMALAAISSEDPTVATRIARQLIETSLTDREALKAVELMLRHGEFKPATREAIFYAATALKSSSDSVRILTWLLADPAVEPDTATKLITNRFTAMLNSKDYGGQSVLATNIRNEFRLRKGRTSAEFNEIVAELVRPYGELPNGWIIAIQDCLDKQGYALNVLTTIAIKVPAIQDEIFTFYRNIVRNPNLAMSARAGALQLLIHREYVDDLTVTFIQDIAHLEPDPTLRKLATDGLDVIAKRRFAKTFCGELLAPEYLN